MYRNASSRVRYQGLLLKPLPFAKKPTMTCSRLRQRAYKEEQRESNGHLRHDRNYSCVRYCFTVVLKPCQLFCEFYEAALLGTHHSYVDL